MSDFEVVLPRTTEEWQRDMNFAYEKGRIDAIDECIKAIVNTPTKVGTHLKESQRVDTCVTILVDRQFEILNILEKLKE